jgi:hypothetical protein
MDTSNLEFAMNTSSATDLWLDELFANKECYCKHVGYQKKCSYSMALSADMLLKLVESNDPEVEGLTVLEINWIDGVGCAFGDNTSLNRIQIYDGEKDKTWLKDLYRGLSRNRTIESFSLESSSSCKSDPDIFCLLSPFFEHNSNLRCIDVKLLDLGLFAASLSHCKMGQLEYINVTSHRGSEVEAAMLFETLHDQPKVTNFKFRMYRTPDWIDTDSITILKNALNKYNTVLHLVLRLEITDAGWPIFSSVLSHPQCSIQILEIEAKRVDVIHLARVLALNNSLRHLYVSCDWSPEVSDDCWEVISRALCHSSSANSTFSSNHMLHKLVVSRVISMEHEMYDDKPIPSDIALLLEMNKTEDKAEVARQKIVKYHFTDEGKDIHVFARMPSTTLPIAIEWIGRNRTEFTLMYEVVRVIPALFERLAGSV